MGPFAFFNNVIPYNIGHPLFAVEKNSIAFAEAEF